MDEREFLSALRSRENFKKVVVNKIVLDRRARRADFILITDQPFTPQDEEFIRDLVQKAVPPSLKAGFEIRKLVCDEQLVRQRILEYLKATHLAAAAFIKGEDISVRTGEPAVFVFGVDEAEKTFFETRNILENVAAMLEKNFCAQFRGELELKEKPVEDTVIEEEDEPVRFLATRTFPIVDFEAIDFAEVPQTATYMKDCSMAADNLTVCGEIVYIQEKISQKGKPYYSITLTDTTDKLFLSYFPKKKTEEKIKQLKQGDFIVCTGANELFNGRLRFTARYINYGRMPDHFVPEKRPSKPAPARYQLIVPEKITDYNQINLFENASLPACLTSRDFVVFDLETTGLNNSPVSGRMDAITEIGAVKIVHGEISEKFTTLVNPERRLEEENIKIRGMTDDMVRDAPKIGEVIPDFFKFCEGCDLVGHNVQFDFKFISYYGAQDDYMFEQKTYDTVTLAQSMLFLSNYKLNTVADYYGIKFNHHRAFDDALATAKIFIELIKAKKCLPNH